MPDCVSISTLADPSPGGPGMPWGPWGPVRPSGSLRAGVAGAALGALVPRGPWGSDRAAGAGRSLRTRRARGARRSLGAGGAARRAGAPLELGDAPVLGHDLLSHAQQLHPDPLERLAGDRRHPSSCVPSSWAPSSSSRWPRARRAHGRPGGSGRTTTSRRRCPHRVRARSIRASRPPVRLRAWRVLGRGIGASVTSTVVPAGHDGVACRLDRRARSPVPIPFGAGCARRPDARGAAQAAVGTAAGGSRSGTRPAERSSGLATRQ